MQILKINLNTKTASEYSNGVNIHCIPALIYMYIYIYIKLFSYLIIEELAEAHLIWSCISKRLFLCKSHFFFLQALIYPLTVASKSHSKVRRDAAEMVLSNLREHSSALVQQAVMVSEELIRVAILWHEQWHESLEDASR